MALLPIVIGAENPVLRKKNTKIPAVTKEIKKLATDMAETMYAANGVGLAAPQVGKNVRLCLVPIAGKLTALVNPLVAAKSKETNMDEEGCLSLPGIWMPVERSNEITLTYTDLRGKSQERKMKGFEARVVQHEVDHLDGVLIVDYATKK